MRTSFLTVTLATLAVQAHPVVKRAVDDATVLNFALTLEHLENAFYKEALEKFDDKAFAEAGLPPWARGRFVQIGEHEEAHVNFLSAALGDKATKPCTYKFPYTDPKSFAAVSQILEGVGVSAYTGAAQFIENKDYLTAAASVLATEARHGSWVASAVNRFSGWSGALDVPLTLDTVFSLAAPFIDQCPSTNPELPVKAFPTLTFPGKAEPGSPATVAFDASTPADVPLFVTFLTGLSQIVVPISEGNTVHIPENLIGTVYAVVSTSDTKATDDNIIAGPAILDFAFKSNGQLI
ncbi:putative ferritin-like domain containing protein [Lyophyllum shimeji]|uniref:Ferritin-like domain containing protein n=1 Tax=Lyophyllum shimeji TaxID=47721 RepID=A0A9P3Q0N7_LYOSH|nr:putative ferritin-like domain containing protein [Lyophyllum shimeji]